MNDETNVAEGPRRFIGLALKVALFIVLSVILLELILTFIHFVAPVAIARWFGQLVEAGGKERLGYVLLLFYMLAMVPTWFIYRPLSVRIGRVFPLWEESRAVARREYAIGVGGIGKFVAIGLIFFFMTALLIGPAADLADWVLGEEYGRKSAELRASGQVLESLLWGLPVTGLIVLTSGVLTYLIWLGLERAAGRVKGRWGK